MRPFGPLPLPSGWRCSVNKEGPLGTEGGREERGGPCVPGGKEGIQLQKEALSQEM